MYEDRLELIGTGHSSHSFIDYLNHQAKQDRAKGQIVMDRKARMFAKELEDYLNRNVHFDELTPDG